MEIFGNWLGEPFDPEALDRKSTRLNSSHLVISYAVFCLKKKNRQCERARPDGVESKAGSDLRRVAGRGVARRENRNRRSFDFFLSESQWRASFPPSPTDARRAC